MENFNPLANLPESSQINADAAEIINAVIAWHGGKMDTLRDIQNAKEIVLRDSETNEEEIVDDSDVIRGYLIGLYVAETLFKEFPISIQEN